MKTNLAVCGTAVLLLAAFQSQADVIAGPITNPANGHDYYLLSPNAWAKSEAEAETLGGTLAIIKNASDQGWVFSTFSKNVNHNGLWIGLHRTQLGGPFAWVADTPMNYTNWATGEPNNAGGMENCVQMENQVSDTGAWNDMPNDALLNGIVEVDHASLSTAERALIGNWYEAGNLDRPFWIAATDHALFVISNNKFAGRVILRPDGTLFVPAWPADSGHSGIYYPLPFAAPQTGMYGDIMKDKILWSNGTWWSRKLL